MVEYDVVTFGSNTVDYFVYSDSELIEIKAPNFNESLLAYPYGSKQLIKEFSKSIGGGGTNTSVAFSRLKLNTGYCGVLGKDTNATEVMKKLRSEKVDFVGDVIDESTGFSIILDSFEKDRTILTYKGANNHLKYENLDLSKLNTNWFYFSSLVNESFETMKKLFNYSKENNINVAFNPSSYQVDKLKMNEIENVDYLIFNKEEAESFLNVKKENISSIIDELSKYVHPVITHGKNGAYTVNEGDVYHIVPNEIEVVESTGAGDAFASGFIFGRIKGYNILDSLKFGLLNSESVITYKSAKKGLLHYDDIMKKFNEMDFEINKLN